MTSRGVSSAGANARASGSVHRVDRSVIDTTGRPPSYLHTRFRRHCQLAFRRQPQSRPWMAARAEVANVELSGFVPSVAAAMIEVSGLMRPHQLDHAQPKP